MLLQVAQVTSCGDELDEGIEEVDKQATVLCLAIAWFPTSVSLGWRAGPGPSWWSR